MTTIVDSNVLIDVAYSDPVWSAWSKHSIARAALDGPLIINQVIFAEFSYRYTSMAEVDTLLPNKEFRRENLPFQAAFVASKAFAAYRRSGGIRERPLPDFFIGAHAVVNGYRILTRDPSGYQKYFPDVDLITPASHPFGILQS